MIAQVRVPGRGVCDSALELLRGRACVLAWRDTVTSFARQSIGHGRRPVSGRDAADGERVGKPVRVEQRLAQPRVAFGFQREQGVVDRAEQFEGADAFVAHAAVRG